MQKYDFKFNNPNKWSNIQVFSQKSMLKQRNRFHHIDSVETPQGSIVARNTVPFGDGFGNLGRKNVVYVEITARLMFHTCP